MIAVGSSDYERQLSKSFPLLSTMNLLIEQRKSQQKIRRRPGVKSTACFNHDKILAPCRGGALAA